MINRIAIGPIWRAIPGFPGYFANCAGEILGKRGWVLAVTRTEGGYLHVHPRVDGRTFCATVNRLVCAAFHGAPPTREHEAAHNDGDPANNQPSNLRWATPAQNCADRVLHGTSPKGERNASAQITAATALLIRSEYAALRVGARLPVGSRKVLCERFGISLHILKDVVANRSWA